MVSGMPCWSRAEQGETDSPIQVILTAPAAGKGHTEVERKTLLHFLQSFDCINRQSNSGSTVHPLKKGKKEHSFDCSPLHSSFTHFPISFSRFTTWSPTITEHVAASLTVSILTKSPPNSPTFCFFLFFPVSNHLSCSWFLISAKGRVKGTRIPELKQAKTGREQRHSRLADKNLLPPSPLTLQSNQSSLLHDTQIPPHTRLCLTHKHTSNEKALSFFSIGWRRHPSAVTPPPPCSSSFLCPTPFNQQLTSCSKLPWAAG